MFSELMNQLMLAASRLSRLVIRLNILKLQPETRSSGIGFSLDVN